MPINANVQAQTCAQTEAQTCAQTEAQTCAQTEAQTCARTRSQTHIANPGVAKAGEAAAAFMLEMMTSLSLTATDDDQAATNECDVRWSLYGERLMRHFKSWNGQGETFDNSSDCSHLAHVAALAMVLWTLEREQTGCDDRPATRAEQLLFELRDGL